jgi:hypothetical protein
MTNFAALSLSELLVPEGFDCECGAGAINAVPEGLKRADAHLHPIFFGVFNDVNAHGAVVESQRRRLMRRLRHQSVSFNDDGCYSKF